MTGAERPALPAPVAQALAHIHRVRGLIHPDRAAMALGIPRSAYDALARTGSRVDRRVVSMAAERLELGDPSLPIGRLRFPIPHGMAEILHAAEIFGLIASFAMRGGVITRVEYERLMETYRDEDIRFALALRRAGRRLAADLGWTPEQQTCRAYGCDMLVGWAREASPALSRLVETALPPELGSGRVHLPQEDPEIDGLFLTVLDRYWGEAEAQHG